MLREEWQLLQKQYEDFEKWSLVIKLSAVLLTTIYFLSQLRGIEYLGLMLVLWISEGIWKTFQQRHAERLLMIERNLQSGDEDKGMLMHTEWQKNRPGTSDLIFEYILSSAKPTVAITYVLLILTVIIL